MEGHSRGTYYKTIRPRVRLAIKMPIRVLIKIMLFVLKPQGRPAVPGGISDHLTEPDRTGRGIASKDGRISASNSLCPPRVVSSKFLMNQSLSFHLTLCLYTYNSPK